MVDLSENLQKKKEILSLIRTSSFSIMVHIL